MGLSFRSNGELSKLAPKPKSQNACPNSSVDATHSPLPCPCYIGFTTEHLLLLVERLDLLDLIVAAHEDTGLVVNVLGDNLEHPPHLAINRLTTGCEGVSKVFVSHRK